ncbi:UNVERIFIED_CONTAM: Sister chromatid cohesion protein 2 [Siphonaria sp. JEL0065]|nr:Sister chromatid cohesion protein 2 [Siphonaria sp. JEL0065]
MRSKCYIHPPSYTDLLLLTKIYLVPDVMTKCIDAITALLKADDLIHAGQLDSSPLFNSTTGLPTPTALESIHRPFKRLFDMGKCEQLAEALEEEEGDNWMKRVLKICERVLVGTECVVTFSKSAVSGGGNKNKNEDEDNEEEENEANEGENEDELENGFEKTFEASMLGLEAACLVLVVINGASVIKRRGFGEETIVSLIGLTKSRFSELFAIVKLYSDDSDNSANSNSKSGQLRDLVDFSNVKKKCARIAAKLCDTLRLIGAMFSGQSFNDGLIISTYVMCIPAFFIESNSISVFIGMEKVQLSCINVIRSVFAQASPHRIPILEEVAGYLVKLQTVKRGLRLYKLRNGKAIQMVSALILTLIQSTFSGTEVTDVVKEVKDVLSQLAQGIDPALEGASGQNQERLVVEKVLSTAKHGLDSAQSCGVFFLKYMLSRSFADNAGKEKGGTPGRRSLVASTESELRVIFENLIDDFLMVLGEPEWPGADFVLLLFSKIMTQTLDDKRSGDTALKSLALDFLGQLTSRLYSSAKIKSLGSKLDGISDIGVVERFSNKLQGSVVKENGKMSISKLLGLWEVQSVFVSFLKEGRENDSGFDYCDSLDATTPSNSFKYLSLTTPALPSDLDIQTALKISAWCQFRRSPLQSIRETLLQYILACLDSDTITIRTRSLKALSDVVAVDATVLSLGSVKSVISNRLLDPSKMVRDAAVELVGSYLMKEYSESCGLFLIPFFYLTQDVGAGVRKRVIKLMKDLLGSVVAKETNDGVTMPLSMMDRVVEIVCKIMGRVSDEETSIQDLSLKSIAEIWFSPFRMNSVQISGLPQKTDETIEAIMSHLTKRSGAYTDQPVQTKFEIKCRATLLLRVVDYFAGVNNAEAIGDVIKQLLEGANNLVKKRDVVVCSRTLVECLTDGILAAEESGDKELVRTSFILLNQIARVLPQLLIPHTKMLHTYLKSNLTPTLNGQEERLAKLNEEKIVAAVVSILGFVIPHAEDPDLNLMSAIEGDLLALLSKRSLVVVNLIVPCLTSIVHHVTKNYFKLTKVLRTCLDNFQKSRAMINASPNGGVGGLNPANARAIARGLIIVSLLVRNFDFDKNRGILKEQAAADIAYCPNVLNSVCGYVSLFSGPTSSPELKAIALQALGNLFIAHPRLMIKSDSQVLMNNIFQTGLISHRIELIKIFVDFLKTEQIRMMNEEIAKKAATVNSKTVDIKVLIGNADEMADAGVSSAVMQMYLNYILEGLMSVDITLSTTAFDAICIIIEQGLAHPLLCVPYVIAMQTSVIPNVRDRAILVYDNLAEKHQTFIHSRTGECVRKAFEYQMNLARGGSEDGPAGTLVWASGYTMEASVNEDDSVGADVPLALLSNMYAKIQVKRPRRNDFLMTLVRSFDADVSVSQDKDIIPFGRFVAENLATLNYKSLDEVLNIIYHICQVLSVSGETVLKSIEDWKSGANQNEKFLAATAKTSILMGMLVKLKGFFQKLYDLSESKCRRFAPSESSRNTEKSRPALRQANASAVMDWTSWPYADNRELMTTEAMVEQLDLFVELMNSDYYSGGGEDEDDLFYEEPTTAEEGDGDGDLAGNDMDLPTSTNPSPVKLMKGKKRASMASAASCSTVPAKKAKRSSLKGSRATSTSKVSFDSPVARPKRSQSRASVAVDLSSDDEDDE